MKKWFNVVMVVMFLAALMSFAPAPTMAGGYGMEEANIHFSGDMRWRGETDGRDFDADTDLTSFSLLRARLNTTYEVGNAIGFVQFQYSDMTNWNSSALNPDNSVDVHQAYLKLNNFIFDPMSVQLGRFEMKYGDERLVGPVGWSNVGRTFEGIRFNYKVDDYWFDLFYTNQEERYPATNAPDDYFAGLWFGLINPVPIQFFVMQKATAGANDLGDLSIDKNVLTLGVHYDNKYDMGFNTNFDFAYQMGKDKDLIANGVDEELTIAAWMLRLEAGYMLDSPMKPVIGVGIDMTTGDSDPADDKINSFDNLYYTGHKFRGAMDMFTANRNEGLRDIFVNIKAMPMEHTKFVLEFHNFASSEDYVDAWSTDVPRQKSMAWEMNSICTATIHSRK